MRQGVRGIFRKNEWLLSAQEYEGMKAAANMLAIMQYIVFRIKKICFPVFMIIS